MTWLILLILLVIVFFAVRSSRKHLKGEGGCCGGSASVSSREETKKLTGDIVGEKIIHIEGMHCDNCRNSVMRQLQRIEGVAADVNLKKKTALVKMTREISDLELTMAVERAGYEVRSIE